MKTCPKTGVEYDHTLPNGLKFSGGWAGLGCPFRHQLRPE